MATIVRVLCGVNFPSSLYLAQQVAFCSPSFRFWLVPAPLSPISRGAAAVAGSCRMLSANPTLWWDMKQKKKKLKKEIKEKKILN